ncbi:MAG TPA: response regulator [Anaerolineales bacterium]|jgi:two-component system NtrC family sensor kinase
MRGDQPRERVLVVDEDADVLDLLETQVLEPMGYDVATAQEAGGAIQQALNFGPDLILASLTLPGLSGKDLLVALRSQGIEVPMLVMAPEGMEADAIQAFRLGARDYLVKPLREAEAVAAIERALNEIRLRRERKQLADQLAESNRQLERRVRELTTIYGIGKAVTSTTNQGQLFSKLMEGSLYVTEADMGWILLRDESTREMVLRAQSGLPSEVASRLHKPWDDGVSSLVMLSGEALRIHGEGLSQFKLSQIGRAALIVPIKVRDQPVGVLNVARRDARMFTERNQAMLEAVTDYASISLVNARLFQALETRAARLEREMRATQATTDSSVAVRLLQAQERLGHLAAASSDRGVRSDLQSVAAELAGVAESLAPPVPKEGRPIPPGADGRSGDEAG